MNKNIRTFMYLLTISAVLLMSVMPSYTVYADGDAEADPPPEESTVTTPEDPPMADPVEPAGAPSSDPSSEPDPDEPTQEGDSVDTPAAEQVTGDIQSEGDPASEDIPSVPEILEMAPDGTDLVLVNEEGDPEPLASEQAAEILVEGDPIWCPEGQVPDSGNNGCTPSYATFGALVTELRNNATYSGNGVIWVAASYNGNDNSTINFSGTNGNLANLRDVSVLGGWSGINGNTSIDPTSPSVLDERLRFVNWTGAVSVSNLDINNTPSGASLVINTDGDISLNNVTVDGSGTGVGASLNNCRYVNPPGACTVSGDVSVSASEFNNNTTHGLVIQSPGEVTIENVTADNNGQDGININTRNEAGADVTIQDTTATNNTQDGIHTSNVGGDLTLTGVTASNNTAVGIRSIVTQGDVKGSNITANDNITTGILIRDAQGNVTVSNITASDNDTTGIVIRDAQGNVKGSNITASDNDSTGILIRDAQGNVTGSNVTASNNGGEGIYIRDTQGDITGSYITTNENAREGLEIDATRGNVYLSNLTANDSTNHEGVDIHDTNGYLKLYNVTADSNDNEGIEIVNVDGSLCLHCVNTSSNDGDGIFVSVDHDFTIKCSQSTGNNGDGLQINLAPTAQLLSFTSTGNTLLDINYNPAVTTLTEKNVDCSGKKKSSTKSSGEEGLFTKLYCLPGEIKVALYDTYGDRIEFNNLCGYDAGVFDPASWAYPETIPGGGDDYITSLKNKMLEEIPNLELDTEHGIPGILAQVLDELPFMLPDEYSYASAFFTAVLDEGEYLDPLPEESGLTVRFRVPEWLDGDEDLSILWWDGVEWVNLGGEYSEDGYYFQVTTEETGVFVLATS